MPWGAGRGGAERRHPWAGKSWAGGALCAEKVCCGLLAALLAVILHRGSSAHYLAKFREQPWSRGVVTPSSTHVPLTPCAYACNPRRITKEILTTELTTASCNYAIMLHSFVKPCSARPILPLCPIPVTANAGPHSES